MTKALLACTVRHWNRQIRVEIRMSMLDNRVHKSCWSIIFSIPSGVPLSSLAKDFIKAFHCTSSCTVCKSCRSVAVYRLSQESGLYRKANVSSTLECALIRRDRSLTRGSTFTRYIETLNSCSLESMTSWEEASSGVLLGRQTRFAAGADTLRTIFPYLRTLYV